MYNWKKKKHKKACSVIKHKTRKSGRQWRLAQLVSGWRGAQHCRHRRERHELATHETRKNSGSFILHRSFPGALPLMMELSGVGVESGPGLKGELEWVKIDDRCESTAATPSVPYTPGNPRSWHIILLLEPQHKLELHLLWHHLRPGTRNEPLHPWNNFSIEFGFNLTPVAITPLKA